MFHGPMLQKTQLAVKSSVAAGANDCDTHVCDRLRMRQPVRIHKDKTPIRIHYIVEWADKRDLKQSEIAEKLDVDKSTVSRWFAGQVPTDKHLVALSGLFELEQPSDLFRHPNDDWLARFFRERSEADRERAITLLELAFPADAQKAKTR